MPNVNPYISARGFTLSLSRIDPTYLCLSPYQKFCPMQDESSPWTNYMSEIGCTKAPQVLHVVSGPGYGWGIPQQPFCTSGFSESFLDTENGAILHRMDEPSRIAVSECLHGPTSGTPWSDTDVERYGGPLISFESYFQSHPLYFDGQGTAERPDQYPGPRKGPKLTVRERARNENGKFYCNICNRRYARRERKETCQNNHTKEKTHRCRGECGVAGCKMSYTSPDCLRRHQWTPDRRRALCPNCDSYTSKQNLARHKKRCQPRT